MYLVYVLVNHQHDGKYFEKVRNLINILYRDDCFIKNEPTLYLPDR